MKKPEHTAVLVKKADAVYPDSAPFHPSEVYPEYPFDAGLCGGRNDAYEMVRACFRDLGLDSGRFGSPDWNPLGEVVSPGQTVLIKPNLVLDAHPRGGDFECLVTHGSVVRAVMDYARIAVGETGNIIVGDSPLQGTDFMQAVTRNGLKDVVEFYNQFDGRPTVRLVDFRQVHAVRGKHGHITEWKEVAGDPLGYVTFDMGSDSALDPLRDDYEKFRVAKYKAEDTQQYHNRNSHRYVIAASVLEADLIISLPKLKTHCKAGVTLGLKNFVGTVGRKQCLAHHRQGSAARGGDEYPENSRLKDAAALLGESIQGNPNRFSRLVLVFLWRVCLRAMKMLGISFLGDGGWHGNDTVWRMVHDLVRIARYGNRSGVLDDRPQRSILTIIDGIVAGENEGPLESTPKPFGSIVAGFNPVCTDVVTTTLMGFDYRKIPQLRDLFSIPRWPLAPCSADEMKLMAEGREIPFGEISGSPYRADFAPAEGWVGYVELDEELVSEVNPG
ncbi:MAG: DUF362 domain-containing protein [Verrucomicrobia bacterium]|nr:DUF362 domain-containing protein [Verrucomicrobiota bacterium]